MGGSNWQRHSNSLFLSLLNAVALRRERERRDLEEAQADLPHKQASSTSEFQKVRLN